MFEGHSDANSEFGQKLGNKGEDDLANMVRNIVFVGARCMFLRQAEAFGLDHTALPAAPADRREPFVLLLADDGMCDDLPTQPLVETYSQAPGTALGEIEVGSEDAQKCGTIALGGDGGEKCLLEKPAPGTEPSRLTSIGRDALEAEIMDIPRTQPLGMGDEIQLADAMNALAAQDRVWTVPLVGQWYDFGSKMGCIVAVVDFALEHPNHADLICAE